MTARRRCWALAAAVAAAAPVACDRRAPIASCDDDLRGVYLADGQRWMVIAGGRGDFEAYPLFDDSEPGPTRLDRDRSAAQQGAISPHAEGPPRGGPLEISPRVLDLARTGTGLDGWVRRRYLRGADRCDARLPARVTACRDNALELVLADPVAPLGFAPCSWPRPAPARVERWRRQ